MLRSLPLLAATLAACSSLLGIEDISTGGSAGMAPVGGGGGGGTSGNSGKGGSSTSGAPTGGASASGGSVTGGASSKGGASGAGGSSSTGGSREETGGKSSGSGGAITGGVDQGGADAGGAGGMAPADMTVRGTVIDYYGHPLPNVPVSIGANTVQTDAQGKFTVPDVAPTYDAVFTVRPVTDGEIQPFTWLYEGLTRRDPTLQVFKGLEWQYAELESNITTGAFGNPPYTYISIGTPGGTSYDWAGASAGIISTDVMWAGSEKTSAVLHALRFVSQDEAVATSFDAYYTQTLMLDVAAKTQLSFAMPAASPPLVTGTVSGKITSAVSARRYNSIFSRFADNAVIPVVRSADSTGENFNYLVPAIPQGELTLAGCHGYFYGSDPKDAVACAYQPVTVGQNNVTLAIPPVPTLVAPLEDATGINESTTFQWASNASVFVFAIEDKDYDFFRGAFVVTAKKQTKVPLVGGSFPLRKGFPQAWRVQVHGQLTSVDDAARPGGFMGSFAWRAVSPQVYRANDAGFFTQSITQTATTAN